MFHWIENMCLAVMHACINCIHPPRTHTHKHKYKHASVRVRMCTYSICPCLYSSTYTYTRQLTCACICPQPSLPALLPSGRRQRPAGRPPREARPPTQSASRSTSLSPPNRIKAPALPAARHEGRKHWLGREALRQKYHLAFVSESPGRRRRELSRRRGSSGKKVAFDGTERGCGVTPPPTSSNLLANNRSLPQTCVIERIRIAV